MWGLLWSVSWWVRYQTLSMFRLNFLLEDRYFSDMIQFVECWYSSCSCWMSGEIDKIKVSQRDFGKSYTLCVAILTKSLIFVALQNQGGSPWFFGLTVHPDMHVWFHCLRHKIHIYVFETWFEQFSQNHIYSVFGLVFIMIDACLGSFLLWINETLIRSFR